MVHLLISLHLHSPQHFSRCSAGQDRKFDQRGTGLVVDVVLGCQEMWGSSSCPVAVLWVASVSLSAKSGVDCMIFKGPDPCESVW